MGLSFVAELRSTLAKLQKIEKEYTAIKIKREDIREQIKKWLELNNLTEYECFDENDNLWNMNIGSQNRRNCDMDLLQTKFPKAYSEVISTSTSSKFTCQQVKSRKKKSNDIQPDVPKGE